MISFTLDMLGWTPNKGKQSQARQAIQSVPAQMEAWEARQAIPMC